MPSDAKKKRAASKKEAAKKKELPKKKVEANGATNGVENGSEEQNGVDTPSEITNGISMKDAVDGLDEKLQEMDLCAQYRSCTGVLTSHPDSRDLKISKATIRFYGAELLQETDIVLNSGRRYGLIGYNGCGKSSLLSAIARREFDIPEHFDIYHLRYEMAPSTKTALQAVMDVDDERRRLEAEADELSLRDDEVSHDRLMDVLERLENMEAEKAEMKAGSILHGLGFTKAMQAKQVKDFSGGWRMRISLARALYISPSILLLDEPTNHLDLEACVWLEETLKQFKRILVMISHSQDFMNGVCTNIIHFHEKKLNYYGGNYDQYLQTRFELEENQMKRHNWEQNQIAHMKDYIARFGHGSAKRARQAQSKQKTLNRMIEGGLTSKVTSDKSLSFYFYECGKIPPPVVMVQHVHFRYADDTPWIYKDLDFGIDLDTRLALVGPNGAGKSTLLKLIAGELFPTDGLIRRHTHLKIGRYHQHLAEAMDMNMSALQWMMKCFPELKEIEQVRRIVGRYGLTGQQQTVPIKNLSDGQRCRVVFAWLAWQSPHLLLMDEPTNHLDIETIDSLADALNEFEGGLILVSHDFRLISQVAEEIWICEKETVTKWDHGIFEYKTKLSKKIIKDFNLDEPKK